MTFDGLFRLKSFHTLVFGEALPSWVRFVSCGGQHALRFFLLMKSELLADGRKTDTWIQTVHTKKYQLFTT
uniref:Uncharacterized protein n=1 Tax=Oryza rufipogon TaxID=4529 RepID=A0A0E0Q3E8_ORYRU